MSATDGSAIGAHHLNDVCWAWWLVADGMGEEATLDEELERRLDRLRVDTCGARAGGGDQHPREAGLRDVGQYRRVVFEPKRRPMRSGWTVRLSAQRKMGS